jgi:hypothetical protein
MLIPLGETITVQVEGQTWRAEQCEHCKQQFYYPVSFAATGSATNPFFLDSFGSRQQAQENAEKNLDHTLMHGVYPVPCPHCTLFQGYMVPVVRANQFLGMWNAGRVLLYVSPTILFLGCLITPTVNRELGRDAANIVVAVMIVLPALLLFSGIALLWARSRKQSQFDPNGREYTEYRRQVAAALTLKPEEFAKLQVPSPSLRTPRHPQGQLVNRNCVRCGERISNELDSRFCSDCGSPVHNRCAVPIEGGCPTCGAGASTKPVS